MQVEVSVEVEVEVEVELELGVGVEIEVKVNAHIKTNRSIRIAQQKKRTDKTDATRLRKQGIIDAAVVPLNKNRGQPPPRAGASVQTDGQKLEML